MYVHPTCNLDAIKLTGLCTGSPSGGTADRDIREDTGRAGTEEVRTCFSRSREQPLLPISTALVSFQCTVYTQARLNQHCWPPKYTQLRIAPRTPACSKCIYYTSGYAFICAAFSAAIFASLSSCSCRTFRMYRKRSTKRTSILSLVIMSMPCTNRPFRI
jgi:hypothetical protein